MYTLKQNLNAACQAKSQWQDKARRYIDGLA